ncbi:hypothetical protein SAMN05877809_1194 [Rhodobacter sp. JA431]|uniref:spike base protein, RCAP_Rcc01079 family n=1 Tax=Rhodobacter sp. JA431 TaxID=570013 RepID=UPI000BDD1E74|nr:hypothetical protein [Rhodobacter sp. JA431]SOC21876.1 hypothetical protein SAMN05877809_1194 [Rhodobacter sp. JA431]
MTDRFEYHSPGLDGPAMGAVVITPSDTEDLAAPIRALTIGGSPGAVRYTHSRTGAICTTAILPMGVHSIWARRIWFTGTSATELTGWE